jgi:carbonic anhydrase/acetyltransferase-like protein (isoleucine patch superfamily)
VAIYALGEHEPEIHPDAYIHPLAVVIGRVRIGASSSVWPSAVIRGDDGDIVIGARTSIQDGAVLHTTPFHFTTVGDDCVIGHLVHLEGCTIESGALVGSNSVVLHRAIVRTGALVGASALVPGGMEVPAGAMALGVPAKLRLDSVNPDTISESSQSYVHRTIRYRDGLRRLD